MVWIATHWDGIPLRYATSFGGNGRPTAWTTRTPLHVFGFPIFAEGMAVLLVGLALGIWYGSQRPSASSVMERVPLALAYLLSVLFTVTGLVPVMQLPIWLIPLTIPPLALGTAAYTLRALSNADDTTMSTSGVPLFVPATIGYGYSLNMANPWSRRLMAGLLLGIALLAAFLIWSLQ
jgi:uncharacterized membrane protein